jgi:hypothetical protein
MIYDFHEGHLAKSLKKLSLAEIKKNSNYFFEPIENINYSQVEIEGNRFFYKKGEDAFMMFSYKYETFILKNEKLPSFHVCNCETMKKYSGFVFSSKMPVKVYCSNRKMELDELQKLPLCGNCIRESQKSFYKFLAKGKPWFDYVLEYARSNGEIATKTNKDGYVIMWKQISEAIREKASYCCSNCSMNLKNERYFLEVHHLDYDKKNNHYNNLKPLCVLCHATVDPNHLLNFKSEPFKVNNFIEKNSKYIRIHNLKSLQTWER